MHTVKDAVCNIYDLITGKDDTVKCRNSEWKLGRSFGLSTDTLKKKICRKNPIVSYSLSTSDLQIANNRALEIKTPLHVDFTPGPVFTNPATLKSHDWKQVITVHDLMIQLHLCCYRWCLKEL